MSASPRSRLAALRGQDLRALHATGSVPDLSQLDTRMDGVVLNGHLGRPLVRNLRLWRGKVFERDQDGAVTGLNRLGLGPVELRHYRFTARTTPSLFGDRSVVLLDHDNDSNPASVRRFHDELVAIDDGLWLATSHYRDGDRLRYLCHFALARPAAT
ncbi:hypothetical protein ASE01_21800 [Nocardioides sp. Root190]|uniref:hypothetical protein n=1 Tax=Nocardioides sp. Root190 TaxID=1736488 RepID=UPI000701AEF7|nr:hypothetical protein [Nocardioides sp. Root190]KRB72694.1 hypothetical protein ASE01_21800 [Nocardioides sp. Root190]